MGKETPVERELILAAGEVEVQLVSVGWVGRGQLGEEELLAAAEVTRQEELRRH